MDEFSFLTTHDSNCEHLKEPNFIWLGKYNNLAVKTGAKMRWGVFNLKNLST